MMKGYFYCKVWQTIGYKDMASYAQQEYNGTFCLMHGLNLHSSENYGLDHGFVWCKPCLSEVVSQVALTNVCAGTAVLSTAVLTPNLLGLLQGDWGHRYL